MNEFGNVGDRKYMYARIEELEAERDRLREALDLALPWLVKASETGLSSCAEAGRRALVNPDQHSDGCLVEIAIRKAKRALNKADTNPSVTRLSIPGNLCVQCDSLVGEDLKCPGCGWVDPLTHKEEKIIDPPGLSK